MKQFLETYQKVLTHPGNTGQRYVMTTLIGLEPIGNKVMHRLACGHDYEATWDTAEQATRSVQMCQDRIGKKQRCNVCTPKGR